MTQQSCCDGEASHGTNASLDPVITLCSDTVEVYCQLSPGKSCVPV
jgi:hypothetical protein